MKAWRFAAWVLLAGLCLVHIGHATSVPYEDLEGSGGDDDDDHDDDDGSGSGSGQWSGYGSGHRVTSTAPPRLTPAEDVIMADSRIVDSKSERSGQETRSFLEDKETLAAVISGGVGALVLALVLVGALVYFLRRREKAAYGAAQQHTHVNNTTYHKAPTKEHEFVIA